jgi:hypothetical protein
VCRIRNCGQHDLHIQPGPGEGLPAAGTGPGPRKDGRPHQEPRLEQQDQVPFGCCGKLGSCVQDLGYRLPPEAPLIGREGWCFMHWQRRLVASYIVEAFQTG